MHARRIRLGESGVSAVSLRRTEHPWQERRGGGIGAAPARTDRAAASPPRAQQSALDHFMVRLRRLRAPAQARQTSERVLCAIPRACVRVACAR